MLDKKKEESRIIETKCWTIKSAIERSIGEHKFGGYKPQPILSKDINKINFRTAHRVNLTLISDSGNPSSGTYLIPKLKLFENTF